MKWFKHISDSLDDPFIFDLLHRFGSIGYLVFFGVLEIYSREFKTELNWNLTVTRSYLDQKLNKRQSTLVVKILKHIGNSGKWDVNIEENNITIFIPKFRDLLDETTLRKLRLSENKSEVSPNKLRKSSPTEVDVDVEVERTKTLAQIRTIARNNGFDKFWLSWPKKKSKADALKAWKQTSKSRPPIEIILLKIETLKNSHEWTKEGGQYIPYPGSWLRAGGWDDEVNQKETEMTHEEREEWGKGLEKK